MRLAASVGVVLSCTLFALSPKANAQEQSGSAENLRGAKIFVTCALCHQLGAEAENDVGPALNGFLNRRAGSQSQFTYSSAMMTAGASGLVWTEEALDQYLENPRRYMPGTTMAHAGLADPEDRAALIGYLKAQQAANSE